MDILEDVLKKSKPVSETKDFDSKNFKKNYINKRTPVLLKGYANNWKAKRDWSFEFLSKLEFKKPVRIEIGNVIQNKTQISRVDYKTYINLLMGSENAMGHSKDMPYLSMFNIFDYFPDLLKDIDVSIFTKYTKINMTGAWIGPSGTISGLHYDSTDNILTQLKGKKMVLLASPKFQKEMYISKKYDHDATASSVDINNYNEKKHPKFKDVAFSKVILEPGDSLFIPKGWWHYVKSLDTSISVSNFGYSLKNVFLVYIKEQILLRLHMRGYYRTKDCTCHMMVDGKWVSKGRS